MPTAPSKGPRSPLARSLANAAKQPPDPNLPIMCVLELRGHANILPAQADGIRQKALDLLEACEAAGIPLSGGFQPAGEEPPPLSPPEITVTGLDPISVVCGAADFPLHVLGTGFTSTSIILFNLSEEPTVFVSDRELTTICKASLATTPVTVPISVVGATASVDFTFLPAAVRKA
jgi:hypothetical protein